MRLSYAARVSLTRELASGTETFNSFPDQLNIFKTASHREAKGHGRAGGGEVKDDKREPEDKGVGAPAAACAGVGTEKGEEISPCVSDMLADGAGALRRGDAAAGEDADIDRDEEEA